jgi:hypothetical protein
MLSRILLLLLEYMEEEHFSELFRLLRGEEGMEVKLLLLFPFLFLLFFLTLAEEEDVFRANEVDGVDDAMIYMIC